MISFADHEGQWAGIVVLNWNGWADTLACLDSVAAQSFQAFRVYVIDNGSSDDSVPRINNYLDQKAPGGWQLRDRALKKVEDIAQWNLVLSQENLGFAGGCNIGIEAAIEDGATWVILLNNDATLEPNSLTEMLRIGTLSGAQIIGARVFHPIDMAPLFQGSEWPGLVFGHRRRKPLNAKAEYWYSGDIQGSVMLLRSTVLSSRIDAEGQVLDQGFFMYCEETDLCRWVITEGGQCVVCRDAYAYHRPATSSGGAGSPMSYYYLTRNRIRLANRWLNPLWKVLFHLYYPLSRGLLMVIHAINGRGSVLRAVAQGLWDGYKGKQGAWSNHPRGPRG